MKTDKKGAAGHVEQVKFWQLGDPVHKFTLILSIEQVVNWVKKGFRGLLRAFMANRVLGR